LVAVQKTGEVNYLVGKVSEILEEAVGAPLRYVANWGRLYSLWPVHLETACCSVEVGAAAGSRLDAERFGVLEAFGSLRQCDLLIVMGTVTRKLAPRLKMVYDQMGEPKWVIAMGACCRGDSKVYTPSGVVRIDRMVPGDVVYSYDEVARRVVTSRVVAKKEQGTRETYRVRAGSYELVATEDHPFAVYSKTLSRKWVAHKSALAMREEGYSLREISAFIGTNPKTLSYWKRNPPSTMGYEVAWKPLSEIEEGDLLCTFAGTVPSLSHKVEYHVESSLKQIKIPDYVDDKFAWLVGLYLGDGWRTKHKVGFSLLPHDLCRPELMRVLHDLFGVTASETRQVVISSVKLSNVFQQSLLLNGNLYEKRIPPWVYVLPISSVLSFLAGFIESDGHVEKQGFAQISSANFELMRDLVEL
jgi:NADH-quinone oxidoreductase subunit B